MSYIYEELSEDTIADKLKQDEYAGWSRKGARVLAEYLIQFAEDIGEPIEFDAVAIRCEYSECALKTILADHGLNSLEELEANTLVLPVEDDLYIYADF